MRIRTRTFFLFLLAGIAALSSFGAYAAVYLEIRSLNAYVASKKEELTQEEERGAILRSLARVYAETKDKRDVLQTGVVASSQTANFIAAIEDVARAGGVSFEVGSVELRGAPEDGFSEITLILRANGSWDRIIRFGRSLETLPYGTHLRAASFDSGETKGAWTASFTLDALAHESP